mmetsp:Transcript_22060/g.45985  ORF Transcript_22060/g.45985 Transcript_22060/m.45985 type:complete len:101 (-) Transcript_22060:207-509(-)
MFRRSACRLAKAGRTIVRDPRKKSLPAAVAGSPPAAEGNNSDLTHTRQQQPPVVQQPPPPLPFEPSQQNQESLGSSMVSYAMAGVGVALGVTLVRVVLGF